MSQHPENTSTFDAFDNKELAFNFVLIFHKFIEMLIADFSPVWKGSHKFKNSTVETLHPK